MRKRFTQLALRTAIFYAVIAGAWIFVSDKLLVAMVPDPDGIARWATMKGWAFVGVTALLLNFGLRRQLRRLGEEAEARQRSEAETRQSESKFRLYVERAPMAVFVLDGEGRCVDCNPAVEEMLDYDAEKLLTTGIPDIVPKEGQEAVLRDFETLKSAGFAEAEHKLLRRDGKPVWVALRATKIGDDRFLCFCKDITRRKEQELEIERLTRIRVTLGRVNQLIARVSTREELFQSVCQIIAEHGGFKVAWVGLRDHESHEVRPVACAGECGAYLGKIRVFAGDGPEGRGPAGVCIREGRTCVFNDFLADARALPWRQAAMEHGLHSVAALPVRCNGEEIGDLVVYAGEMDVFQDKEVELLEELAGDVSFVLDYLEQQEQKRRAEEALRRSEEQFRAMFETASIGMAQSDPQTGRWLRVNRKLCDITGYSADELLEMSFSDITHPDDRQADWEKNQSVVRGEVPDYRMEKRYIRKDGTVAWVNVNMTVIRDAAGQPVRTMAAIEDITERRRIEAEVRGHVEELRARNEELQRFIRASTGREMRMIELKQQVNDLSCRLGVKQPYPLDFLNKGNPASAALQHPGGNGDGHD